MRRILPMPFLLLVQAILLGYNGWVHSPVYLEVAHLPAGIRHLEYGEFDIYRVNPPLVRMVAALPMLWLEPKKDWSHSSSDPLSRTEYDIARDFIKANGSDVFRLYTIARWFCIPFMLLGGYICFHWANELYGYSSGLTALCLWCFSPYLLGHGALIMPDGAAASMALFASYCFWKWIKEMDWIWTIWTGIVIGLALLTKSTLVVLAPTFCIVFLISIACGRKAKCRSRQHLAQACLLPALAISCVNIGYDCEGSFQTIGEYRFQSSTLSGCKANEIIPGGSNRFEDGWFGLLPLPFPKNYIQGIDTQKKDFETGFDSYISGTWSDHGWWYYYLYALAIKEPLGTWALVALAVGTTVFGRGYSASWHDETILVAPCLAILVFVSLQTGFSVHSRYAIPALPFVFVWTSKVARAVEWRPFNSTSLVLTVMTVSALAWSVGSSLSVYPHSLSYFNELAAMLPMSASASYPEVVGAKDDRGTVVGNIVGVLTSGPRNGPRHLLDSNTDWGQDLLILKGWLDGHSDVELDGLALWGSCPVSSADIPETPEPLPGTRNASFDSGQTDDQFGPRPGWYAISVNHIYGRKRQYRYFLHFEPVATAGYSIYIYHITLVEVNRVRRKLKMPELARI